MSSPAAEKLTQILSAVQAGETDTAEAMLPLIYEELRGLAHAKMAHEPAGHTLTATALVHEAYLRLVQDSDVGWKSRAYFFAAAAEAMRRILVERARRVAGLKRGGDRQRVAFEAAELTLDIDPAEMLAIDDALAELEHLRPRTCQVTKLRYFAGLTAEETASALDISVRTVRNEWRFARAWLHQRLIAEMPPDGRPKSHDA